MLKIYLAGPWSHRPEAWEAQKKFEAAGFEVISHWITRESNLTYEDMKKPEHKAEMQEQALMDVNELVQADIFVIMNLELSEGKATELGMAYSLGIPVILVGERSRNVFYFLPNVFQAASVEIAIEGIKVAQQMDAEKEVAN